MPEVKKITVSDIIKMKAERKRITMITAYDYPSALMADRAGIDIVLVGDSGGMVVLGYEDTIPITMDEMVMLCKAVSRGAKRPLIVADMPFMSYNVSSKQAIHNAGRLVKEGGADAVKVEGGSEFKGIIRAMVRAGIPVMGHLGLMPQTATLWSGYRLQGKSCEAALTIIGDAEALVEAGAFSIVLESVTSEVAEMVRSCVRVPIIGIGAGPHCDGQVLVLHDVLGLYDRFLPKFAKQYASLANLIQQALEAYRNEVASGAFPGEEHTYHMSEEEHDKLVKVLKGKGR